ncbi:hypothetical protein RUND412_004745 [Rhizina undulata]
MCNFKNTIYTCGCTVEENTSLCGYHDDVNECMNNTTAIDVKARTSCGKNECRGKARANRNIVVTVPQTPRRSESNEEVKRVHFSPTVVNIDDRHNDYFDESSDESIDQME